ncbi:MAG: UDP-3-O-acyl-N-acetylglucosamine deacetylase [Vulcanimicrobiota bacterium]
MKQRTVANSFDMEGIGLHKGKKVHMTINPAPPDSGIVFVRSDCEDRPRIAASFSEVTGVERCTALGKGDVRIITVEHFLASAYGLAVDNLEVEIDNEELPALDGSARLFCQAFMDSGIREQEREKRTLEINAPLYAARGDGLLIALPGEALCLTCIIAYDHPMVKTQLYEMTVTPERFFSECAPARTYGFWEEVEGLYERNLALGGSLENAVVIKQDSFMTPLRFDNEMVRHKCLDLLGDLALLGCSLKGHIISLRAGHALNIEILKLLSGGE